MSGRIPVYEYIKCDCGGTIRIACVTSTYTPLIPCVCEKCDKRFNLGSLKFSMVLFNNKTGQQYPMKAKEDADFSQIKRIMNGENITTTFYDIKENLTTT
jgi:hypothetical protein